MPSAPAPSASLFSYVLPSDDGVAPNPFWGTCTLAICKPRIRSVARTGDWVVGTGSKHSPIGDISGQLVFAMRVTATLTMEEYDALTAGDLAVKRPSRNARDWRKRLGDSIYDFTVSPPAMRPGVHGEADRERDLSGVNVLLSKDFLYLGDRPIPVPAHLRGMIKHGQGHRSVANAPYVESFVNWIRSLDLEWNRPLGEPQVRPWRSVGSECSDSARPKNGCTSKEAC